MQVANVTTPANYFHILRRQVKRDFRKPLILMSQSRCRHKRRLQPVGNGRRELLPSSPLGHAEVIKAVRSSCRRIRRSVASVMCSGKVYYDLLESARSAASTTSTCCASSSSIRSRPRRSSTSSAASATGRWSGARKSREHGRWAFIDPYLEWVLAHIDASTSGCAIPASAAASPATGLMSSIWLSFAAFLEDALGGDQAPHGLPLAEALSA